MMHMPCTWLECEESKQMETAVYHEYLAGKAFLRDTQEIFCSASLYYLIHTFCTHAMYSHINHNCWRELLRENPSQKPWELEIAIPTYLYTFACGFSSTPTSPFLYHWEVDSPNTYHTLSECHVRIWCCWEVLEEVKDDRCNMELVVGSRELDKTKVRHNLVEVGAWRA